MPPRGMVACRPQGAQQGHRCGFTACSWQYQGKELTPAPGTGQSLNQPHMPPSAQEAPLPTQYQVCLLRVVELCLEKTERAFSSPAQPLAWPKT